MFYREKCNTVKQSDIKWLLLRYLELASSKWFKWRTSTLIWSGVGIMCSSLLSAI